MPFWLILAIVFAIIGAIGFACLPFTSEEESKFTAIGVGILGAVLAILLTVVSSANTVPIRSVGIVTSFGKPTGQVTGSGFKWVAPWEKVGEWDAGNQKYDHIGDKGVRVRTATLADAWAHVLIQWRVKPENAPEQFMAYKGDFEEFKGQRVGVQLDSAVNDAFADYNPLQNIDKGGNLNVPLQPFADKIKSAAEQRLGSDVEIISVTVTRVDHDEKTENNIKTFQDKLAQGRNLDQDKINADKAKAITDKNSGRDKQAWCLEISEKNGTDPGPCLFGSGNTSVILDSRKK